MKIGLLGFGVVGRGVYEIAAARDDMQVTKVVCLEDVQLPDAEVTKNFQDILEDATIDTVVEAMGGLHPAYEFVRAAIEAGKNIVSSNKALVASFYEELIPLARSKGVSFRCTAAVGGGIGWLSELERSRRAQNMVRVGGIMNGTCNYILDNMTRKGLTYADALAQAQALGYAEANPATDVEGIDTLAFKWTETAFRFAAFRTSPRRMFPGLLPTAMCVSSSPPARKPKAVTKYMSSLPCAPRAHRRPPYPRISTSLPLREKPPAA